MKKEYHKIPKLQPQFSPHDPINQKILKLLRIICHLSQEVGYCYAFNDYLASKVGVSLRTIKRYVRKVENAGYIQCYYSRKRAYWRHIYLTELGEEFFEEDVTNTTVFIRNNNTKESFETDAVQRSLKILSNYSVSSFSDNEIEKKEGEIEKLEDFVGEFRSEITEMWKRSAEFDDIREKERECSNLLRAIMRLKSKLDTLRRKRFDQWAMKFLRNIPAHVKRFLLFCKHKGLNFIDLYEKIVKSITKGSLSICKATGKPMHNAMGFNIAMKLIRENRLYLW